MRCVARVMPTIRCHLVRREHLWKAHFQVAQQKLQLRRWTVHGVCALQPCLHGIPAKWQLCSRSRRVFQVAENRAALDCRRWYGCLGDEVQVAFLVDN